MSVAERERTENEVTAAVATLYVAEERAEASVEAARANVELFSKLQQLADDQRQAGIATRLDTTRAEVALSRQRQALLVAENRRDAARLALLHATGADQSSELLLTDPLTERDEIAPPAEAALRVAREQRPELRELDERLKAAESVTDAERAERLPHARRAVPGRIQRVPLQRPLLDAIGRGRRLRAGLHRRPHRGAHRGGGFEDARDPAAEDRARAPGRGRGPAGAALVGERAEPRPRGARERAAGPRGARVRAGPLRRRRFVLDRSGQRAELPRVRAGRSDRGARRRGAGAIRPGARDGSRSGELVAERHEGGFEDSERRPMPSPAKDNRLHPAEKRARTAAEAPPRRRERRTPHRRLGLRRARRGRRRLVRPAHGLLLSPPRRDRRRAGRGAHRAGAPEGLRLRDRGPRRGQPARRGRPDDRSDRRPRLPLEGRHGPSHARERPRRGGRRARERRGGPHPGREHRRGPRALRAPAREGRGLAAAVRRGQGRGRRGVGAGGGREAERSGRRRERRPEAGRPRIRGAAAVLHRRLRAGDRRRLAQERRGRAVRAGGTAAARDRLRRRSLGRRELQGNAAEEDARRAAGRDRRGRVPEDEVPREGRVDRARRRARSSRCCRPTTRPATSRRSCSAFRSRSSSPIRRAPTSRCAPA